MQIFRQGDGKKMKILLITDMRCRGNRQRNTQAGFNPAEWKKEKREADDSRTEQRKLRGEVWPEPDFGCDISN